MNIKYLKVCLMALAICLLAGCGTAGGLIRLGPDRAPKPESFVVSILPSAPDRAHEVVAVVSAHHYKLDKATTELKRQARLAGADALIEFKQECKFSGDTWGNEYFVEAKAIVFK